jgi:ubiquinone/menaquinone biosynthesis C-methylase UbiE
MDAAKLKAATTYNAAADHFDDERLQFWTRIGRRTIDRLELRAGAIVLDVGCGAGSSAIPAAERVGWRGQVVGVDLAERLLEIAAEKAIRNGLLNVRFVAKDMERLCYPDGCFDAVVAVFSIFFVADMTKQLRELWRMCRPGGTLAVTTWGPRVFEPGTSLWWDAVREARPDLVPSVSPWEGITDPRALGELMEEAGIADAEIAAESERQALRSPDDWWTIVLGSGFRWTVEQLGEGAAEQVRRANIESIRRHNIGAVETNAIFATARKPLWLSA